MGHMTLTIFKLPSNGRAELAVKYTKHLLMDNIDSNGDLNIDKMVRALLMKRNTPDHNYKLSPAEVLFGHPLRDSLPFIRKDIDTFDNPQMSGKWRGKLKKSLFGPDTLNLLRNLTNIPNPCHLFRSVIMC